MNCKSNIVQINITCNLKGKKTDTRDTHQKGVNFHHRTIQLIQLHYLHIQAYITLKLYKHQVHKPLTQRLHPSLQSQIQEKQPSNAQILLSLHIIPSSKPCIFYASVNTSKSLIPQRGVLTDTVENAGISKVIVNVEALLGYSPKSILSNFKQEPQMILAEVIEMKVNC
ncbi:unnamed protein product [Paramecium octaurelia]|uniref:Uncharacterized protein n=1 Tax=Paramecium octaurelia TaxID=43137 RepID=A0A8S1X4W1_PAROT|nr:unnamed protein product [Paramecium octaurelia]